MWWRHLHFRRRHRFHDQQSFSFCFWVLHRYAGFSCSGVRPLCDCYPYDDFSHDHDGGCRAPPTPRSPIRWRRNNPKPSPTDTPNRRPRSNATTTPATCAGTNATRTKTAAAPVAVGPDGGPRMMAWFLGVLVVVMELSGVSLLEALKSRNVWRHRSSAPFRHENDRIRSTEGLN